MHQAQIIQELGERGFRIFSTRDFKKMLKELNLNDALAPKVLKTLLKAGVLRRLYRGHYALSQALLAGSPLNEYEIALHLTKPSLLCCWSAFALHGLTDQVLNSVYVMTLYQREPNSPQTVFQIDHMNYQLIRVQPSLFFGEETKFLTDIPLRVTDLERTLLDGLMRPHYCGGFLEVMEAFRVSQDHFNLEKMILYGERISTSVLMRLGWMLDFLEIKTPFADQLQKFKNTAHLKLDVSGPSRGPWNSRWNLRENIS